jgi:hypothetical protein
MNIDLRFHSGAFALAPTAKFMEIFFIAGEALLWHPHVRLFGLAQL